VCQKACWKWWGTVWQDYWWFIFVMKECNARRKRRGGDLL